MSDTDDLPPMADRQLPPFACKLSGIEICDLMAWTQGYARAAIAHHEARPLTWIDETGVAHTVSALDARLHLRRFYDEWPGGFEEIEAALKARGQPAVSPAGAIELPVLKNFDQAQVIGTIRLNPEALPTSPNYVFALGYRSLENGAAHELLAVSLVNDKDYAKFLRSNNMSKLYDARKSIGPAWMKQNDPLSPVLDVTELVDGLRGVSPAGVPDVTKVIAPTADVEAIMQLVHEYGRAPHTTEYAEVEAAVKAALESDGCTRVLSNLDTSDPYSPTAPPAKAALEPPAAPERAPEKRRSGWVGHLGTAADASEFGRYKVTCGPLVPLPDDELEPENMSYGGDLSKPFDGPPLPPPAKPVAPDVETAKLLPCPFCGMRPDLEDPDTLYPSGTVWRKTEGDEWRSYHNWKDRQEGDGICYAMHCPTQSGGCGADITADSRAEAIAAWNRRAVSK